MLKARKKHADQNGLKLSWPLNYSDTHMKGSKTGNLYITLTTCEWACKHKSLNAVKSSEVPQNCMAFLAKETITCDICFSSESFQAGKLVFKLQWGFYLQADDSCRNLFLSEIHKLVESLRIVRSVKLSFFKCPDCMHRYFWWACKLE